MSRINAAALGAALLIGFAGVAGAQATTTPGVKAPSERRGPGIEGRRGEGRRGFGGRRGDFGGRFAKDLNLTDAQKAQVKSIHEKYKPQFEAIRTQFKGQAESIKALRAKGDTAGARAAREKLRTEVGQRSLAIRQREQGEIRNILTAEQRTKFDAAQAARKKWMDEHAKDGRRGGKFGRGARPQRG